MAAARGVRTDKERRLRLLCPLGLARGHGLRSRSAFCDRLAAPDAIREGHAWVQFSKDGKEFLLEPTAARLGNTIPRLSTLRYHPKFSVAWNGTDISFYSHNDRGHEPPFLALIASVPDWMVFWVWVWVMRIVLLPLNVIRRLFASRRP